MYLAQKLSGLKQDSERKTCPLHDFEAHILVGTQHARYRRGAQIGLSSVRFPFQRQSWSSPQVHRFEAFVARSMIPYGDFAGECELDRCRAEVELDCPPSSHRCSDPRGAQRRRQLARCANAS
jgi:hypothetical protein